MKYAPREYAAAFLEVLGATPTKKEKEIMKRFLALIRKNGDWNFRKKISDAVEEAAVSKAGGRIILAQFARATPLPQFLKRGRAKDVLKVSINPKLVAGLRVTINGSREADFSFQRKLRKLFANYGN